MGATIVALAIMTNLPQPYLLFLGDTTEPSYAKTAFGLRDWAAECTNFPREVVEQALAHSLPDKVEAAYRRGDSVTLQEYIDGMDRRPRRSRKKVS